jgi:putative ABC transport system permease protein
VLDYALKNIFKRSGRSLLTVFGVSVMIALVIVITGIVDFQVRTMHAHASAGAGKINVQPVLAGETYPAEGIDLTDDVASAVFDATRTHIQASLSAKALYFTLAPPRYPNEPPEVILTGVEPGKEEAFTGSISRDVRPLAGVESFGEADTSYPVILGNHAAEYYGNPQPGDTLAILEQQFTVIGILDESADIVVNNAAIVPMDVAQALLDKHGFVSSVILTASRVGADEDIVAIVQSQFPRLVVVTDDTIMRNAEEGIKLFEQMVQVIAVVVVLSGALLIMTVMLITVKERTREIGVLRALGASTGLIIRCVFWEIFLLSTTGSVGGAVAAGFVLRFALAESLFNLAHILKYLPLAVVLTLLSGVLPALSISRVMPVESLRYE